MLHKLKKSIESITGYWIFKKKHLPAGTDLKVDLERLDLLNANTVFDVGANVGQTARYYSHLFPVARIFSFEPVQKSFEKLRNNTSNLNRVDAYHIGFGAENEKIEITLDENPTSTANSLKKDVMNNDPNGIKEVLSIKKIDTFSAQNDISEIDLLKIDTEGWELQTLQGAQTMLENHKIKAILCEVGFTKKNIRNTSFASLNAFMSEIGFYFYAMYDISHLQLKNGNHYGNALYISKEHLMSLA